MGKRPCIGLSGGMVHGGATAVLLTLQMLWYSGCSLEWEGPHLHREESYIVPPGTELHLTFPGDGLRDVAVDYDAADSIKLVTPPPHMWRSCQPYRKVACEVRGPIHLHNDSLSFHEVSVRVEPSPSPLCTKTPVSPGDLMGALDRNSGSPTSGGKR